MTTNHNCDYTRPGVEAWWNTWPVSTNGSGAAESEYAQSA